MRASLRFSGKILSATVSRGADRWFVRITVDTMDPPRRPAETQGAVGVDLGVSARATRSTGETITGPKAHTARLKRAKRRSRRLSRTQKDSANRRQAKAKLARLHARIVPLRRDALDKRTSDRTGRFHPIGIEDLTVRGPDGEPPSGPLHCRHALL
jgi:putative transposase